MTDESQSPHERVEAHSSQTEAGAAADGAPETESHDASPTADDDAAEAFPFAVPVGEFRIAVANEQSVMPVDEAAIRKAVVTVLRLAHVRAADISVAVVDHELMHVLNRRHLQHDYPTDVLSFVFDRHPIEPPSSSAEPEEAGNAPPTSAATDGPATHGPATDGNTAIAITDWQRAVEEVFEEVRDELPAAGCFVEGELIISAEMAAERCDEFGWPADHELLLYAIHGAWHLCGVDDSTDEDKRRMSILESAALTALHINRPADR